jgi:hypothetical protein
MNTKLFLLPLTFLTIFSFTSVSSRSQTVITFDDIAHSNGDSTYITNGYQGLDWNNIATLNPILKLAQDGPSPTNGLYYNGMVSASNVAFGGFTSPTEIYSVSSNFNFLSVYMTGAWNSNLNVEVQGFGGTTLLYDQTVVLVGTTATQIAFNYVDIDRLVFNSYGGEEALGIDGGPIFVMDNFTFEFIPEPSSLLLTALGAVTLWAFVRRKRA